MEHERKKRERKKDTKHGVYGGRTGKQGSWRQHSFRIVLCHEEHGHIKSYSTYHSEEAKKE